MRDKLRNHLPLTEIGWKLEVVAAREGEERATFFASRCSQWFTRLHLDLDEIRNSMFPVFPWE